MVNLSELRTKVNSFFENTQDGDPNIDNFYNFLNSINLKNIDFWEKIQRSDWVHAADPIQICDFNSEEDKNIRASAIFNLLIVNEINNSDIKILDYGSGEGHISKQISNYGKKVWSYDIENVNKCAENFTTNFDEIKENKYDIIFIYDVLDHSTKEDPVEVLKKLKLVLSDNGKMIIRCHPWSSRHGTHLWSLNKAYAHLFITEKELEYLGHKGLPTIQITHPNQTYQKWFKEAGLDIESEIPLIRECGIFVEKYKDVKSHLLSRYPNNDFDYSCIETEFIDYILK